MTSKRIGFLSQGGAMLWITRKALSFEGEPAPEQVIQIGPVRVVIGGFRANSHSVRVGIEAPREMLILRGELIDPKTSHETSNRKEL
jgi:sRNA-binding carbon storage regulator CsrA